MEIFPRRLTLSLIGFCYFAASASQSISAEKPFYDGKTLSVRINYAPGGPTDVEGRLLARHLSGNPSVVVQNMAGAAVSLAPITWGKSPSATV